MSPSFRDKQENSTKLISYIALRPTHNYHYGMSDDGNLVIFREATKAIDKAIDVVRKIGDLINSAINRGAEIVAWNRARRSRLRLTSFLGQTSHLLYSRNMPLISELEEVLGEENAYSVRTLHHIVTTLHEVDDALRDFAEIQSDIITEPFYSLYYGALIGRQNALARLLQMDHVRTAEQRVALGKFVEKYSELISQLKRANDLLADHIKKMQEDGKWPTGNQ